VGFHFDDSVLATVHPLDFQIIRWFIIGTWCGSEIRAREAHAEVRTKDLDRYTYRVTWSRKTVNTLALREFPSLSWLASSPEAALSGARRIVAAAWTI